MASSSQSPRPGGKCFVCGKSLEEGDVRTVKKKGIESLVSASVQRGIKEHTDLLKGKDEITVHFDCSKRYSDLRLKYAAVRSESPQPGPSSKQLRSVSEKIPPSRAISFKGFCFLCLEKVDDEYMKKQTKLPQRYRNPVRLVERIEFRDSVLQAARARGDEWGQQIINRIPADLDLVAADCQYHDACYKKLYQPPRESGSGRGRRHFPEVEEAMEDVYSYLEENKEECQFSFEELMGAIKSGYQLDRRTLKSNLLNKYGDDIIFVETANKSTVCFKSTGYKILNDAWYSNKESNPQDERMRVVQAAASIILEDIRSQVYNTTDYPPPDEFLNNVESDIPPTLSTFLQTIVLSKKKGSLDKWKRICTAISHAVIAAARPRSFLSSLLTGLSVFVYRKFGSKLLIDVLSSCGFASSHHEAQLLETSAISQPPPPLVKPNVRGFCQLVFDNADFNINTIDGHGTFHAMGGIICITPFEAAGERGNVKRSVRMTAAQLVSAAGSVPLQRFVKNPQGGLKTVQIKGLGTLPLAQTDVISQSAADISWLHGKSSGRNLPGWNGFMENATTNKEFHRSKIVYLPFINAPPSNHDTVYTALLIARRECDSVKQKTCFVTFDQPLYMKAQEILHNGLQPQLKGVIARLGGFHLLMSFLGAIGTIMGGSGIAELFATIYAENSIVKMLYGHAYSRAVRAHILTHQALSKLILDTISFTDEETSAVNNLLSEEDQSMVLIADDLQEMKNVKQRFMTAVQDMESRGPTAQLWVQYYNMVTLVKQFIEAERMGNFQLHLDTIKKMMPFFHAAGHWHYAKSAHLYLQEMTSLKEKMDPTEYQQFTAEGSFTIRRSNKFWSGIWTDMTIEQKLMKDMKVAGGLTGGRGMTESTLSKWTLGMTYLQDIAQQVENYTEVTALSSEQHVEMRPTRITRDTLDVQKLLDWFSKHPPFPEVDVIMSISSGIVGSEQVNCHLAQQVGIQGIQRIVGTTFGLVSFKKKDKVVSLASDRNTLKVGEKKVTMDPLTLYHRMCIAKTSEEDLKEYLSYELAPFPMSLFNEDGMRKGPKSALYSAFKPLPIDFDIPSNRHIVIDGGHLLHKVVWNRNSTFGQISDDYVNYIHRHYGTNVTVVFDGYPDSIARSTKSAERARRCNANASADVVFDSSTMNSTPQEKFLLNENNKKRFVDFLRAKFETSSISTVQAEEDADVLIVTTAISISSSYDAVMIVGEDIDLLVIMTGTTNASNKIFFKKPGRGNSPDEFYSTTSFKYDFTSNVLLIHAISGCDTTSHIFGFGKTKFCSLFQRNPILQQIGDTFTDPDATQDEIFKAGEQVLVTLYGGHFEQSLTELRHTKFISTTANPNLAKLPPTPDAARYHYLRVYHQVMTWMGIQKDPLQYGWARGSRGLTPIKSSRDPAPLTLLRTVSCRCVAGCSTACGCRKSGLNCTTFCKFCCGQSCDNRPIIIVDEDDEDMDEPPTEEDFFEESPLPTPPIKRTRST